MPRVFIGVKAPRTLQERIRQWAHKWQYVLPVQWVPTKDLHLTLVPPWQTHDAPTVIARMRHVAMHFEAFPIILNHVLYGPHPRQHPRLIWAKGHPAPALEAIAETLGGAVDVAHHTPFTPHITLARFAAMDFHKFGTKVHINDRVGWTLPIAELTLFESPTRGGVGYHVLGKVPLIDKRS